MMTSTSIYPNTPLFSAGKTAIVELQEAGKTVRYQLSTVDAGQLQVPSGKLIACDPFVNLDLTNNTYVDIPAGTYPVVVTIADVSEALDGSHTREAYCSLIIRAGQTTTRQFLSPSSDGNATDREPVSLSQGFYGIPVDAGTVCFADVDTIARYMPKEDWYEQVFDTNSADSWFAQMDNGTPRDGIANIVLPQAPHGENIVICHSGWGDGFYPLIGSYDADDNLLAVHIDLMLVADDSYR